MVKVNRRLIAAYLLPTFLAIALINVFPILTTLYLSFTKYTSLTPVDVPPRWNNFANYSRVFNVNGDFPRVILNTLLYVVICVALFVFIGLATAMALNNKRIKGLLFWRLALIVPWTVPSLITALIWKTLFDGKTTGIFNLIIQAMVGNRNAGVDFYQNPYWAYFAVVIVNLWLSYPFFTIVILGALQSIPHELNEAASVDGATAWTRFSNITLPLLRPAITPAIILSAITTFQMFNTVYLLTGGDPHDQVGKAGATEFIMVYVYRQITGGNSNGVQNYGVTSAIAVVLFIMLFAMVLVSLRVSNVTREVRR